MREIASESNFTCRESSDVLHHPNAAKRCWVAAGLLPFVAQAARSRCVSWACPYLMSISLLLLLSSETDQTWDECVALLSMPLMYLSLWGACQPPPVKVYRTGDWYVACSPRSRCWGQGWSRCQTPCPPPTGVWAECRASSSLITKVRECTLGSACSISYTWEQKKKGGSRNLYELPLLSGPEDTMVIDREGMALWVLCRDVEVIKTTGWRLLQRESGCVYRPPAAVIKENQMRATCL